MRGLEKTARVTALCVIAWNEDEIRPWVTAVRPEALGDGSAWDEPVEPLDPVVVEALKSRSRCPHFQPDQRARRHTHQNYQAKRSPH